MTDATKAGVAATSGPGGEHRGGFFAALGRFIVHNPWKVIGAWIIVAVAVIATAPGLPTTTNESSFLPSSYESIRAQALQDQAFPQQGHVTANAAIIVFSRPDGGPLTSADTASVGRVADALNAKHIPNIRAVTPGQPSANKLVDTAFIAMDNSILNSNGTTAGNAIKALRADITPLMSGTGLNEGVTGTAAQQLDSQQSGSKAQAIVAFATLLLILILLLIIFRSPIIAIMPLFVIGRLAGRDGPDRRRQQGAEPERRQFRDHDLDRRALRHRD